jgi:hypothetical protein
VTRSLSRLQAVILGIVVLAGLGLAVVGLFWIGGKHTSGVPDFLARWILPKTFQLRAGFAQIQGVEVGTRVRVKGIEAGEIVAIERPSKPSGQVVLVMRLDSRHGDLIRKDASAQIVAEGMVGGKVVEIDPGSDDKDPVKDGDFIAAKPSVEISDILTRVDDTIREIRDSKGSLNKLIKDDELHTELVQAVRQLHRTASSLQQNSDAFKDLPVVRGYVKDMRKELLRPDCERNRRIFAENELFEPGSAILTADGRRRLDDLVPWLDGLKHKGSEVVVAAYALPGPDEEGTRILTQKQSETVSNYLTTQHSIQKMGWFSWSRRVVALGCGSESPPAPEKDKLPPARLEVIVFVPHN